MVATFPIMAASLMLGQVTDIPPGPAVQPSNKVYVYSNGQLVPYSEGQPGLFGTPPATDPRHPILSRIQGWFGKRNTNINTTSTIETSPPPLLSPSTNSTSSNGAAPTMPPATASPATTNPASQLPAGIPTKVPVDYPRKMPTSLKDATPSSDSRTIPGSEALSPVGLKSLPTPMPVKTPILPANVNRIGRDDKFEWVTGQLETEKGQYVLYYATPETVDPHHGRIVLNPQKVDMHSFHSGDLISVRGHLTTSHANAVYQLTSADLIERAKK